MEFPVPAYTTFVIPTGATTGARIVLDGTTGKIFIYNSSNNLVDVIGGPSGNIISYVNGTNSKSIAFTSGQLTMNASGSTVSGGTLGSDSSSPNGGVLFLDSGNDGTNTDGITMAWQSGLPAVTTGNTATPRVIVIDDAGTSDADFFISGSLVKTDKTAHPYTWQTPTYKANWSAGVLLNGLGGPAVKFRLMPDDTVWIYGLCTPAAGAGTTIFTLPAGYFPTTLGSSNMGLSNFNTVNYAINTANGDFIVSVVNVGQTYLIDARIPLRNVP